MKRPSLFLGALLGGLSSFSVIALAYLGEQWVGLPFFPFEGNSHGYCRGGVLGEVQTFIEMELS